MRTESLRPGGLRHVAAYLAAYDLSSFDAKAPPPQTSAFLDIIAANRAPEDAELADVLDAIRNPNAVTLPQLIDEARRSGNVDLAAWLGDRKNCRQIPHRMSEVGYEPVRSTAKDSQWVMNGVRRTIYALATLSLRAGSQPRTLLSLIENR